MTLAVVAMAPALVPVDSTGTAYKDRLASVA
jgi:hypothetical protein